MILCNPKLNNSKKLLMLQDKMTQAKLAKLGKYPNLKYVKHIPIRSSHYYQALDYVYTNIAKTAKILEIGSFIGSFLHVLDVSGYKDILGIDIEPEFVDLSMNLWGNNVILTDIYSHNLTRQSFDFILCINLFFDNKKKGHRNKEEMLTVMSIIYDLLKNKGQVYVKPSCFMPEQEILDMGYKIVYKTNDDHPQYVFQKIN